MLKPVAALAPFHPFTTTPIIYNSCCTCIFWGTHTTHDNQIPQIPHISILAQGVSLDPALLSVAFSSQGGATGYFINQDVGHCCGDENEIMSAQIVQGPTAPTVVDSAQERSPRRLDGGGADAASARRGEHTSNAARATEEVRESDPANHAVVDSILFALGWIAVVSVASDRSVGNCENIIPVATNHSRVELHDRID